MAHLRCSRVVPGNRSAVYEFLTAPSNQAELLADTLEVEDLSLGLKVEKGAELTFSMRRFGLRQTVRLLVTEDQPNEQLTYRQTEGLFVKWTHTMRFSDHGRSETLVTDLVDYRVPLGLLGNLVDDLYLRRDLTRLLEQRLDRARLHFMNLMPQPSESGPLTHENHLAEL